MPKTEKFSTEIWDEEPEVDNPFAAAKCFCRGYDVFGELLHKASWSEYMLLLFSGEKPTPQQANIFERIAVILAHPGIRDPSVHASMSAGAGGSTGASSLMAALAVGAGHFGGARELFYCCETTLQCGADLQCWERILSNGASAELNLWPSLDHAPGFDPYGTSCAKPVRQALNYLSEISPGEHLSWLKENQTALESIAKRPLNMVAVVAAALLDLKMTPPQAELLYLMLRLPGAAVHALEQERRGWRFFPFFRDGVHLEDE